MSLISFQDHHTATVATVTGAHTIQQWAAALESVGVTQEITGFPITTRHLGSLLGDTNAEAAKRLAIASPLDAARIIAELSLAETTRLGNALSSKWEGILQRQTDALSQAQAHHIEVTDESQLRLYSRSLQHRTPEALDKIIGLYRDALERPLVGFDPRFIAEVATAQAQLDMLKRHASYLRESGVTSLSDRRRGQNFEAAITIMDGMPHQFQAELRKKGLTTPFAIEYREQLFRAAEAIGEINDLDERLPLPPTNRLHPQTATLAQIQGALLGGAVGDAFGLPFESMAREQIIEGGLLLFESMSGKGERPAGRWSDDTLLVRATVSSLLEHQALVPRRLAQKFAGLTHLTKTRGFGRSTKLAFRKLRGGETWKTSGIEESSGNGAAMRVSPIAIFDYRDLEALKRDVILSSQMTHANYEAISGALAVAFILAKILRDEFDPKKILAETRVFIGPGRFSSRLKEVESLIADTTRSPEDTIRTLGTGGSVWESVASAIYSFLSSPKDFSKTIVSLVRAGGDTDTMASIAGTLSGALNGLEGIPARWIEQVEEGRAILNEARKLEQLIHNRKSV